MSANTLLKKDASKKLSLNNPGTQKAKNKPQSNNAATDTKKKIWVKPTLEKIDFANAKNRCKYIKTTGKR